MLNDLSIRIKLFLLVGVTLFLMLVLGVVSLIAQERQNTRLGSTLDDNAVATEAIQASDAAALRFKIQVQEWKNLLMRGHDQKEFDKYLAAFQKEHAAVGAELAKTRAAFVKLGLDATLVDKAQENHAKLQGRYLEAVKQFDNKNPLSYQLVDRAVRGIDRQPTEDIDKLSNVVADALAARAAEARADAAAGRKFALALNATVLLFAVVLSVLLSGYIIRGIANQMAAAVRTADSVAQGDLTVRVESSSRDELGQLLGKLKHMTGNLSRIVSEVRMGSSEITAASQQIAGANMDLSARTEEQASAIEETSSTLEELTATVRQNNDNTQGAASLMAQTSATAARGEQAMQVVVDSMDRINAGSRRISEIIGVIDGIAFQTNILALNAAVEAARAGEQGRGFAVVAGEVRTLAQRSATAAKEIKSLIGDSVSQVEEGHARVHEAAAAMSEIVDGVQKASHILAEIATTTREQTTGIEQVNTTISQMEQVTQENAAMVEEASAAAQSLNEQADKFLAIIAQFKVEVDTAAAPVRVRAAAPTAPRRPPGRALKVPGRRMPVPAGGPDDGEWTEF